MAMIQLSNEMKRQMTGWHRQGWGQVRIRRALSACGMAISTTGVAAIMKRLRLPPYPRGGRSILPTAQVAEILRLYRQEGWGMKRISRQVGIPTSTIKNLLQRQSVPMHRVGWKAAWCVDCGRATGGAKRCPFHRRVHRAEESWWQRQAATHEPRNPNTSLTSIGE